MRAYSELYLPVARENLGCMFDVSVASFGFSLSEFYQLFLQSSVSARFQAGDPAIIAGRSGIELTQILLEETRPDLLVEKNAEGFHSSPSPEFWTGQALAYYQWASASSFLDIERSIPIEHIRSLFNPYHEMDIAQFCDKMDALRDSVEEHSSLKRLRLEAGLSQSELAQIADVPVRTIQQYEQGQKKISHARAEYVLKLSQALCCAPVEILENRANMYEYAVVSL